MLKSVAIIATAVATALAASQGFTAFAAAGRTSAPAVAVVEAPPPAAATSTGPAQVSKAKDGHYWAEAQVDGRWVHFLVDTGASAVALTSQDAQRLGFDLSNLVYDRPVATANGKTLAARV